MASQSTQQSPDSTKSESYRYDVFISSSPADADWVNTWLIPKLRQGKLRICIPDDCFEPGAPVLQETERAIRESRRLLIVLSPDWMGGEWSNLEALLAQSQDPGARWRRVIPLLLAPCAPSDSIKLLHWVDLTETDQREQQMDRIIAAIQGKSALPELQLSAFPEARVRRLELRWYTIAGIFAFLTLAVLVAWIYWQVSTQNPTRMPDGAYNIAIANFGLEDSAGTPIPDSALPDGAQEAREQVLNLSKYLNDEKQELHKILNQDINIWGPDHGIQPVAPGTEEKRVQDLNANILIYGTLEHEDANSWDFDPAFYVPDNPLDTTDELNGEHNLGAPLPYKPGLSSTSDVNKDLKARMKALSGVLLALDAMSHDTVDGYRSAEDVLQTTAAEFASSGANKGRGLDVIYLFLGNAYIGESNLETDPEKRQGLLDKAVENFKTAIGKNADYPRAYNGLGSAYFQQARTGPADCDWDQSKLQQALDAHTTALGLPADTKPPSGYVDLRANLGIGRVYYSRGYCGDPADWDLAEKYYEQALAFYQASPKVYLKRPASIGYTDFATMALRRSFIAQADQAPALRAKAIENYTLAKDLALEVNTPGSREQAIATMPFLIYAYCQDGQTEQAQKTLDKFIQKFPDPPSVKAKSLTGLEQPCVK